MAIDSKTDVQRQPKIAVTIKLWSIGVLVIVAGGPPTFGNGQILVRKTIVVRVSDARQLRSLDRVKRTISIGQPKRLVECLGETVVLDVFGRVVVRAFFSQGILGVPNFL